VTGDFKDHFSTRSNGYARYRPTYPDALFDFLASVTSDHSAALDCATGNGQAAVALTRYFTRVFASDASQSQIDAAVSHPRIEYRVARAEQTGLADSSLDLVTAGQAAHWFDEASFMDEARRILKPSGVLAIWCYETCEVSAACDAIIDKLYREIVGEYWPAERVTIEQGYSDIEMPGVAVPVPEMAMSLDWSVADMIGYLGTWSACKRYEEANRSDPVDKIMDALTGAWGDGVRQVSWPLRIKVSRANTLVD